MYLVSWAAPQYPGVPTSIVFAWLLDSLMLSPKSAQA